MNLPLSKRFNTNYCPNDNEITTIQHFLGKCHLEFDTKQLDAEIVACEESLDALRQREKQLTELLNIHTPLLSPFRRLPPGVLREIFYQCRPHTIAGLSMSQADYPVALTRVCSSWRRLALDTPQLWTFIYVSIPTDRDRLNIKTTNYFLRVAEAVTARANGITEWLRRSQNLPINVFIDTNGVVNYVPDLVQSFLKQLTSALLPSVSRWKSCYSTDSCPLIANLRPSIFLELQLLSLNIAPWTETPEPSVKGHAALQVQHLNTIQLEIRRSTDLAACAYLPAWTQIQHLSIVYHVGWIYGQELTHTSTVLSTLKSCVSLVSLRLQLTKWHVFPTGSTTVTLPHLRSFSLDDFRQPSQLLGFLDLPQLEEFEHHFYQNSGRNNGLSFEECTTSQFLLANRLRRLELDPISFPVNVLSRIVKGCTFLRQLHLCSLPKCPPIPRLPIVPIRRLLRSLSTRDAGSVPCPELEEITCGHVSNATHQDILNVLNARTGLGGVARLKRLYIPIACKKPPDPSMIAHIKGFNTEDGVKIEVPFYIVNSIPSFMLRNPRYGNLTVWGEMTFWSLDPGGDFGQWLSI